MTAEIPGNLIPMRDMTYNSGYGGGNAIAIQTARLIVGPHDLTQAVSAEEKGATFTLDLTAGPTHLQTYFYTEAGDNLGAYYVYIDQVRD